MSQDNTAYSSTLLQYEQAQLYNHESPRLKYFRDISTPLARKKNQTGPFDGKDNLNDILNGMFPPRIIDNDGERYIEYVSNIESSRQDLKALDSELKARLIERQARKVGLCPVREDLHFQLFDEIIRQVTINCPERGFLLLRVRDDTKMTIAAYQNLYQSSVVFGANKQLQAEEGKAELEKKIEELERRKRILENKKTDLTNRLEATEKSYQEIKTIDQNRRQNEINFLKYQSKHLESFLITLESAH